MPFAHLSPQRVSEIRQAFIKERRSYDEGTRALLFEEIDFEFLQRLRTFPFQWNQLGHDLDKLNSYPKQKDGRIPCRLWLKRCLDEIFVNTVHEATFTASIEELDKGPYQQAEMAEIVVEGLEALIELIRTNQTANSAVVYYRRTFDIARWEIDVIANYKSMHDALHQIQLIWPDPNALVLFQTQFKAMKPMLVNYVASLDVTVGQLWSTYYNAFVDETESKWITQLEQYQKDLAAIVREEKQDKMLDGFSAVNNLLRQQMSLLNTRLKEAIDTLHLNDLIRALTDVCKSLTTISPNNTSDLIKQYGSGIDALKQLDRLITDLIRQHNDWQGIDLVLASVGDTIGGSAAGSEVRTGLQETERLVKFTVIKSIIKNRVEPLLTGKSTVWAQNLHDSAKTFNDAVDNRDTNKAEQAFDAYKQQAWHLFFEIDSEMKVKCEELRVIGQNLEKVNDQLRFNAD
jgi:hypothetical protein